MRGCFEAVTTNAAKVMGLERYGLAEGNHADFVVLDAVDPIEALRLRAARLFVVRRGKVLAQSAPRVSEMSVEGRPAIVSPAAYAPNVG
jgi:cytosine deaminase